MQPIKSPNFLVKMQAKKYDKYNNIKEREKQQTLFVVVITRIGATKQSTYQYPPLISVFLGFDGNDFLQPAVFEIIYLIIVINLRN